MAVLRWFVPPVIALIPLVSLKETLAAIAAFAGS